MRCLSFCTADAYNIDDLVKLLRNDGYDPKFYHDVIHIQKPFEDGEGDLFIFSYGCVVFWGFDIEAAESFLAEIEDFTINPLPDPIQDESSYHYGEETTIIEENDEMILEPNDVLIKLSMSYGLSQSVKLTVFENSIDRTIIKSRFLPGELATKGKISLSRKKLSQKLGALFAERNSINLHSDILDTPEFFWRRPRYEPYYLMASRYMDINTRVEILNKRLDVIRELYEILSNELKHIHSSRLEFVIILLILIEVIVAILRDILKWV